MFLLHSWYFMSLPVHNLLCPRVISSFHRSSVWQRHIVNISSTHHCFGATKPQHVSRIEVEPLIVGFGSHNPLRPCIPTNKYPAIKAPRTVMWGCVWSGPALERVQMMGWIHKKLEWASNNRLSLLSTCGQPGWEALAKTTLLTHEEDPVTGPHVV